ncbi:MAG: hypothetical protein IAF38_19730, partial [Bacteroidia bacterium]|nr:hypothetical protein [Bacteroidia bacterium]
MKKHFLTLSLVLFISLSVFSQTNNRIVLSTFYNQVNDYKDLFINTVGDDTMARHKIKKFTETVVDETKPEKTIKKKIEYFYERDGSPVKRIFNIDGEESIYTFRYDRAKNITFKSYRNLNNFDSMQFVNGKISAIVIARGDAEVLTETRRFIYGEDELLEKITDPTYKKKEKVLYAFKYTDMHMISEYYHFEKEKTPEWEKKEDKEKEDKPKGKYAVALLDKFYFNSE